MQQRRRRRITKMDAEESRSEAVQARRAHLIEQTKIWDEKIAKNKEPRTWETYLPAHHRGKASKDALKHFRALLDRPLPEGVPRQLTRTQIAMIDEGWKEPDHVPEPPKRKRAKKEPVKEGPAKGSIADLELQASKEWDGIGVSPHGRRALDAAWALDFGPNMGNPFRTRLTRDMCLQLGAVDYYSIIKDVCDLPLCRERLNTGAYENDAALRRDIRKIAENALQYHGPASPYTTAADQLAAAFDAALAGA